MDAYSVEHWHEFLVAAAGASAALAGLVFIGISINVSRIIALPGLPARAAQTIAVLGNALAITLVLLNPAVSHVTVGLEVLLLGLAGWIMVVLIQVRSDAATDPRSHWRSTVLLVQLATVPFLISGVSTLAEWGGGLYWMQAGVVASMLVGLVNGWVLLIEILR